MASMGASSCRAAKKSWETRTIDEDKNKEEPLREGTRPGGKAMSCRMTPFGAEQAPKTPNDRREGDEVTRPEERHLKLRAGKNKRVRNSGKEGPQRGWGKKKKRKKKKIRREVFPWVRKRDLAKEPRNPALSFVETRQKKITRRKDLATASYAVSIILQMERKDSKAKENFPKTFRKAKLTAGKKSKKTKQQTFSPILTRNKGQVQKPP